MIHYQLGQDILNRLLLTSGNTGVTREEDLQNMLETKFVMGEEHDDFVVTSTSDYESCAYVKITGTAKHVVTGRKGSTTGAPEPDRIENSQGAEAYGGTGQYVKIPIKALEAEDGKLCIGFKTKDAVQAVQAHIEEYNGAANLLGKKFVDFESITESKLKSLFSKVANGLQQVLNSSNYFVPPTLSTRGEYVCEDFIYNILVLASKEEEYVSGYDKYGEEEKKKVTVDRYTTEKVEVASKAAPLSFVEEYVFKQAGVQTKIFPQKAYIGLFTTNPLADGTGFVEPISYSKDSAMTYRRMNLHEGLFSGEYVFNNLIPAVKGTKVGTGDTAKDVEGYAELSNKEIIMFPEVLTQSWGVIEGFGIFENEYPPEDEEEAKNEHPYFWGEVSNPREASVGTVPLFRADEFKIYLG